MSVIQGNDGKLKFIISANKNGPSGRIMSLGEYIELLNDDYTAGVMINNKAQVSTPDIMGSFVRLSDNGFGIILGNEFNPLVYRGLNNDLCFMPTSLRYELFDGNERIRHSIERMKKQEFISLISRTAYCARSKTFEVYGNKYRLDPESIAKLYNFVSDCIDVTRDILVAYFYAYTYIDKEKNQVMPVKDFSYHSPTLYVGNLRRIYNELPQTMANMSFHPFVRAKVQQSMSLNTAENYNRLKELFIKVDLPKNPDIAEYIYNRFDGGKALFPGDFAARTAVKIRNDKILQINLFKQYCDETNTDAKWLREQLIKLGYEFDYSPRTLTEDDEYMINREIDEIIIPYIDSQIKLRTI